jgi:acetylornithine/succinyldiaminopimelate/putrescine aminotransferase
VPGAHGSTFGGNPVACAAALAVLDALDGGVLDNVKRSGEHLARRLAGLASKHASIKETRGRGLIQGIEMELPTRPLVEHALERGLVTNSTAGNVIRIIPPLVIETAEIDEGVDILDAVIGEAKR